MPQAPISVTVAAAPIAVVNPPLPAPVKLQSPAWQECWDDKGVPLACVTLHEAAKTLHNKVAVGRWMSSMSSVVEYYRGLNAVPSDQKVAR